MAWVKQAGGSGGSRYGQGNLWAQTSIPVFEPPAFTDPGQGTRPRNRAEPYVRARQPEHGPLGAKVTGVSRTLC